MVRIAADIPKGLRFAATPDSMPIAEAEALARALARWEPSDDALKLLADRAADARAGQEFLDVYSIEDARTWDPNTLWSRLTSSSPDRLKIPLGRNPTTGKTVFLDLKEAAEGGMGPHGMMTGMTGSGKSETLLQFALSMAVLHPPEMLQLLLGDFKGESAFAPLVDLPHAQSGVISNMAESEHKLNRFEDALNGEVSRRLRILKKTGYKDVRDYERARATTRPGLEPLGALVIIIDEFSELLRLRPTIAEVCDTVGRQGRALWIHIINASQRAEVGKMSGLMAQQTFSIGLKVKDAGQSRMAIDSPRAFDDLKGSPQGTGFLVYEGDHFKFRSWLVSAPFIPPKPGGKQRRLVEGQFIEAHRFNAAVSALPIDIEVNDPLAEDETRVVAEDEPTVDAHTVCEVLVERLALAGRTRAPMHRMWLPPLDEIAEIGVDEMAQEFWGRSWLDVQVDSGLVIPMGRGDDPFAHTQELVAVDLSGAGGNVGIAGAAQVGKSTALRTMMMMLAVSHSPARVQFYCLDFGGGKLASIAGLPHVSAVAAQGNVEKIGRVLDSVERLIQERARSWEQAGIDLNEFRARKFGGKAGERVPEDDHGDVFLVIDNIRVLQSDYELTNRLLAITEAALNYGVHMVISSGEWLSIKSPIMNKLGTKIELRLANPTESGMLDRKAAAAVPNQPGRALQSGGLHMLLGAPVAGEGRHIVAPDDGVLALSEQEAVAATATQIAQVWESKGVLPAPRMRVLPTEVHLADLGPGPQGTLRLGVGERNMDTIGINLVEGPHFLAVGASGCGRSTLLKSVIASIKETFTAKEAFLVVFDVGLGLVDAYDPEYVRVYLNNLARIAEIAAELAKKLDERRPPSGLSADELARWRFNGERIFVIVDDINLMTPAGMVGGQSVLAPLIGLMERGRQVGLHIIATSILGQSWFGMAGTKFVQAMHTGGTGLLVMDGQGEKVGDGIKAAPRVPGRGELAYRRAGHQMIQVALPPAREASDGDVAGQQGPGW